MLSAAPHTARVRRSAGLRQRLTHLPRETRDTWFLLAVIAWITLPLTAVIPLWASLLAAAELLWRGWLAWAGRPLPRRRWLAALLMVALTAIVLTYHTLIGREPGVALIALLLSLKTLELRARRDAFVVFFLGFFVLLTNFLYSQSMALAAAMLAGLWGLLTALVNAHRPVGQPRLRESARTAFLLTLAGAPVMALLFVFFPRLGPLWAVPNSDPTGRSGLSATMDLGAISKLALDDGIALRVRFQGQPPPQNQLYFRGPVLSYFDGRAWTGGGEDFAGRGLGWPRDLQVSGDPVRYEVTLEPNHNHWLLALDATPEPLSIDGSNEPRPQRAHQTRDLQWLSYRPITDLLRYHAASYAQYRYGPSGPNGPPPRYLALYLRLPPGANPRTAALGAQLRAQAGGKAQNIVDLALARLRTGGYAYTLEPGPTAPDSADQFWFDTKAGFCEHIASAFALLMRAAGVPARIVTGYQGGELNDLDGYWVVRNADAHAWTEVWLDDRGWARVDPTGAISPWRIGDLAQSPYRRLTPPEGLVARAVDALNPTLLARLRTFWDAVNNGWNQWVLNYTQARQLDLLRALGFATPDMTDLVKILIAALILAALLGAAWTKWERGHRDPWLRLLARAQARLSGLARAGVAMPPAESEPVTPRALLRRVQASDLPPDVRLPLLDWLLRLEQWRYAAPSAARGSDSLTALQKQWRHLVWPTASVDKARRRPQPDGSETAGAAPRP
jgi:transglutaminase-like putative cysteine protease